MAEPDVHGTASHVITADSSRIAYRPLLRKCGTATVQLVIMHPPYFDIIKFSDHRADLSNAPSVEAFTQKMGEIVERTTEYLDEGRYLAIVIGDKFSDGEWIPLGFLVMNKVLKLGFRLKSIIVKNFDDTMGKRQKQELWRFRALVGNFYIFKHEYIFLFEKLKERPQEQEHQGSLATRKPTSI
jgi:hypothetical protein